MNRTGAIWTRGWVAKGLLLAMLLGPAARGDWDPEPFRRSGDLAGRPDVYDSGGFLNRYTYRGRPERELEWLRAPEGLLGTIGSLDSDELYVDERFRKQFELTDRTFVALRQESTEDFDGEYDRFLTGLGADVGAGWSLSGLVDLSEQKSDVDVYAESLWAPSDAGRMRFAVALPDAWFNDRVEEVDYRTQAVTYYHEAYGVHGTRCEGGYWINWNAPLELISSGAGVGFEYEQLDAGLRGKLALTDRSRLHADAAYEDGARRIRLFDVTDAQEGTLNREVLEGGLRWQGDVDEGLDVWFGLHGVRFTEEDDRFRDQERVLRSDRTEWIVHSGFEWQVKSWLLVWPGLYVDFQDNRDERINLLGEDETEIHDGALVKLALPFEFVFKSAVLTVNPTLRLDEFEWGGGNFQLQMPL